VTVRLTVKMGQMRSVALRPRVVTITLRVPPAGSVFTGRGSVTETLIVTMAAMNITVSHTQKQLYSNYIV